MYNLACRAACGLLLSIGLALQVHAAPKPVANLDRVLVIVNNEVITESELAGRLNDVKKSLAVQKIKAPPENVLRKQVLERMVLEKIQLQLAARTGIRVEKTRVDEAIENIAQQNRLAPAAFLKAIKQEGVDPARFREQIRTQLLIQQLVEREVTSRIIVTDSEVENFLAGQDSRSGGTEYNLSHIFIKLPETATAEAIAEAKVRAENLWRDLKQGANFEQTAIANSQSQTALEGGRLGWKKAGQLPGLFNEALSKLQPGQMSEVLRSPNGFHILKLNDRRGQAQARSVTQAHLRHILIRSTDVLPASEAKRRIEQLRDRIVQGEDFAALARVHSDDLGSASKGGDIGWLSPGQISPEFERAVAGLKVNDISAPVVAPYGVHLIQLLGRREHDISNEVSANNARQQLHNRKADERYDQWVRQLIDEAYVEYRVEEYK